MALYFDDKDYKGDYEPLVGDLNDDCKVDFADLELLMENWLKDISLKFE